MDIERIIIIPGFCAVILWATNPSFEQHRPVATNHIHTYVFEKQAPPYFKKWYLPKGFVVNRANEYSCQLANQIEYQSYLIFSMTRLRYPKLDYFKGTLLPKRLRPEKKTLDVDTPTSVGFLGMVF